MTTLITFDVDGTLVRSVGCSANTLHKAAFAAACLKVFQIETNIDCIQHHGGTDPLILTKLLHCEHGIPVSDIKVLLPRLQEEMVYFYETKSASVSEDGLEVLPGVPELLDFLQKQDNTLTCLVTGNLESIGWHKMAALNLKSRFSRPVFGGFGSDFCSGNFEEMWRDRAELIRIARAKANSILSEQHRLPVSHCYHVGDTPNDICAAASAGAIAVAVCTGAFSRRQLEDALKSCGCPGVVLDDLHDLNLNLVAFGMQAPKHASVQMPVDAAAVLQSSPPH
jgi:phosphoglycolate phosphatase-like HAD superfamily hydrolase